MSKVVRIEYQVTSLACHWVEVPDWFDATNPYHRQLLTDNEDLKFEEYQHEEITERKTLGMCEVQNSEGGMDFTDLKQP